MDRCQTAVQTRAHWASSLLTGVGLQASARLPTACDTRGPTAPGGIISEKKPPCLPHLQGWGSPHGQPVPEAVAPGQSRASGRSLRRAMRPLHRGAGPSTRKHGSPR